MTQEESRMKIKALAPWFGAKRNLAPRIVEVLGPHSVYWEPFCGSMAVLLAKQPCSMETVNDLHEDLFNLAMVIQDRGQCSDLYKRLRHVLVCEKYIDESRERLQEPLKRGVDRAFWYFINSWIGRNGTAGTKAYNQHFCRRFTKTGGAPAVRYISAVQSIPAWWRRLQRVAILNMDAFEILEKVEDQETMAMYVDPPYFTISDYYLHDFADQDHIQLATLLRRFKRARIVLSYYDHPKLSELYPDWYQEKIEVSKALSHQGKRGKNDVRAVEVLLCNQPIQVRNGQGILFNP